VTRAEYDPYTDMLEHLRAVLDICEELIGHSLEENAANTLREVVASIERAIHLVEQRDRPAFKFHI
jgi:hypothetical protein